MSIVDISKLLACFKSLEGGCLEVFHLHV